jgi:hypothetical protein
MWCNLQVYVCGVKGSSIIKDCEQWKKSQPDLLQGYESKNVFNAHET